jgi:hypothetical protein
VIAASIPIIGIGALLLGAGLFGAWHWRTHETDSMGAPVGPRNRRGMFFVNIAMVLVSIQVIVAGILSR